MRDGEDGAAGVIDIALWDGLGEPFDVIFCRNVMIYFDLSSRAAAVEKLVSHLMPGGYLVIGYSESLLGIKHALQPVGQGVYKKP